MPTCSTVSIASVSAPAIYRELCNAAARSPFETFISRVTGGVGLQSYSGTISDNDDFGAPNLFLMNPAGILFGPTAQLNVGGSFHATTADYIKLGTDGIVYADPAKASALTSAPPSAFGFLTANPGRIDVQAGVLSWEHVHEPCYRCPQGITRCHSLAGR